VLLIFISVESPDHRLATFICLLTPSHPNGSFQGFSLDDSPLRPPHLLYQDSCHTRPCIPLKPRYVTHTKLYYHGFTISVSELQKDHDGLGNHFERKNTPADPQHFVPHWVKYSLNDTLCPMAQRQPRNIECMTKVLQRPVQPMHCSNLAIPESKRVFPCLYASMSSIVTTIY